MNKLYLIFSGIIILFAACDQGNHIVIREEYRHGSLHFVITTKLAEYYYDTKGGGFSHIIDIDGNDWINFNKDPWNGYPESAAGWYRGLPNFVYGSDNSGAGHPGFELCRSKKKGPNRIWTESIDGKWKWEWTFHDMHAVVHMKKTDPNHPYWFLYEGTIGGKWDMEKTYWGTHEGLRNEFPDCHFKEFIFEKWNWAFFGNKNVSRVLFVAQINPDDIVDVMCFLGNSSKGISSEDGMVVFGFGRGPNTSPLLTYTNGFIIGFFEKKVADHATFQEIKEYVEGILDDVR